MDNFTYVNTCKLCKSSELDNVLQLAPLPIGDRYVPEADKMKVVDTYPIDIMMCRSCGHYQNSGYVDPELIYAHYLSRPATTNPVLSDAYKEYVDSLLEKYSSKSKMFAVEAGSNDGAFIAYLQEKGSRVLGVEPSPNLSKQANDNGIPTVHDYFSLELARKIKNEHGEADFFIANHTFSNVIDLNDFVKGVKHLLTANGIFSMQTHYHLDVMEKNLVENFTHEHLSGFYVKPLKTFFQNYDLELFDVQRVSAKAGSIRCLIKRKNGFMIENSVAETIAYEESIGMDSKKRHETIADFIQSTKTKLHVLLDPAVEQGKIVAAFGTSTGATTFSYNYDLGGLVSFFVDDDPYRHNLVSPGLHIPVLPSTTIYERKPDYVIILAPLYADKIMRKNKKYLEQGGTFVKIWPKFETISA
jgi:hypothetical protein